MMRQAIRLLLPLAALGLAVGADTPRGYVDGATIDVTGVIPPAPTSGDIRDRADHRVYVAMKRLIGTPRWRLATADVAYATPAMEGDFACATGLMLTPQAFPATTRLLDNANADAGRANGAAKNLWRHLRPYRADNGATCEDKAELGASYDYPSGHTMKGWTFGLVLSELLPDRTTAILTRARAYGESRIVCRVHTMSAVESGRLAATTVMSAIRETPGFRADLAAARAEIAAVAGTAGRPDPAGCAREAEIANASVLAGLHR